MRQLDVQALIAAERAQEAQGAVEHGIAGSLCRQADVEPAMSERRLQPQVGQQGEFCLAFAHRGLDDEQDGRVYFIQQPVGGDLQRACPQGCLANDASCQYVGRRCLPQ